MVGYFAALLTENETCYLDLLDEKRYTQISQLFSGRKARYGFSLEQERNSIRALFGRTASSLRDLSLKRKGEKRFEVRMRLLLEESFHKGKFDGYAAFTIDTVFLVQLSADDSARRYKIAEVRETFPQASRDQRPKASLGFAKCYFSDCYEVDSSSKETSAKGKATVYRHVSRFIERDTKTLMASERLEQTLTNDAMSEPSSVLFDGAGNRIANYRSFSR